MLLPSTEPRPSRIPAAPNWAAAAVTFATALGGLITALQSYQSGQDTQRAAYEALRAANVEQSARIAELVQGQGELRAWVQGLSGRLDERTTNTEKAIRKVVKPKAAPLPPPAPPPAPPPVLQVTPAAPLPSFEELGR